VLLKQETCSLFAPITHDVALFAVTLLCLNAPQECFKKCKISRVKLQIVFTGGNQVIRKLVATKVRVSRVGAKVVPRFTHVAFLT
jgi:hypothetical protein